MNCFERSMPSTNLSWDDLLSGLGLGSEWVVRDGGLGMDDGIGLSVFF